jgi:hypothetical protein
MIPQDLLGDEVDNTLGDVVTCVLVVAGVIIIPVAIARAWWPDLRAQLAALFIMSREAKVSICPVDTDAVPVPVLGTDTMASTSAEVDDISEEWEMPRVGGRFPSRRPCYNRPRYTPK